MNTQLEPEYCIYEEPSIIYFVVPLSVNTKNIETLWQVSPEHDVKQIYYNDV